MSKSSIHSAHTEHDILINAHWEFVLQANSQGTTCKCGNVICYSTHSASSIPSPPPCPITLQARSLMLVGTQEGDKQATEDKKVPSQAGVLRHQDLQKGSKLAGAGLPGHVDVHFVLPQVEGATLQLLPYR